MAKLPPKKYASWSQYLISILPGFLLALIGAVIVWYLSAVTPANWPVNYVLYAIILGMILRNVLKLPALFKEGLGFSSKILLFMGVIFLGGTINFAVIISTGPHAVILAVLAVTAMITLSYLLGKLFGLPEDSKALLGIGMGVCGVSAIVALTPVIKAKERYVLTAIVASLLNSVILLFVIPLLVHWTAMPELLAGYWSGAISSNTAQAIATGFAIGEEAGTIATITKTARNALMAFAILFFAYLYTRKGLPIGVKLRPILIWEKFPKFIFGLLIMSLLSTFGLFSPEVTGQFKDLSRWCFMICFVGMGYEISFRDLKLNDLKPVLFGLILSVILVLIVYLYLNLFIAI